MLPDIIFEWLIMYLCLCMQTSVILEAKLIFQAKKGVHRSYQRKKTKTGGLTSTGTGRVEEPRPYRAPVPPSAAPSSVSDRQYGHENRGGPSMTTGTVGATVPCDRTDLTTKHPKIEVRQKVQRASVRSERSYRATVPPSRFSTQPGLDRYGRVRSAAMYRAPVPRVRPRYQPMSQV